MSYCSYQRVFLKKQKTKHLAVWDFEVVGEKPSVLTYLISGNFSALFFFFCQLGALSDFWAKRYPFTKHAVPTFGAYSFLFFGTKPCSIYFTSCSVGKLKCQRVCCYPINIWEQLNWMFISTNKRQSWPTDVKQNISDVFMGHRFTRSESLE